MSSSYVTNPNSVDVALAEPVDLHEIPEGLPVTQPPSAPPTQSNSVNNLLAHGRTTPTSHMSLRHRAAIMFGLEKRSEAPTPNNNDSNSTHHHSSRMLDTAHAIVEKLIQLGHHAKEDRPTVASHRTEAVKSMMVSDMITPDKTYINLADSGHHKVMKSLAHTIIQSVLAGFSVGWGSVLASFIGGIFLTNFPQYPGISRIIYGLCFPVGLVLIVALGSELFTGDCILSTVAWLEGDVPAWRFLFSLVASWFGNLAGALAIVYLIVASGTLMGGFEIFPYYVAHKKVYELSWKQVYVRALLGNWLVDLAITLQGVSTSFTGKTVACYLPIFTFAALQFEHCIANMILVPLGIEAAKYIEQQPASYWEKYTAPGAILSKHPEFRHINVRDFIANNLIAATLGNFTGGAVFVGIPYFLLYGKYAAKLSKWTTI